MKLIILTILVMTLTSCMTVVVIKPKPDDKIEIQAPTECFPINPQPYYYLDNAQPAIIYSNVSTDVLLCK